MQAEANHPRLRRLLRAALALSLLLLAGGVVLLWAWNALAPELFGAPEIGFRHALALELLLGLLVAIPAIAIRAFAHHPHAVR